MSTTSIFYYKNACIKILNLISEKLLTNLPQNELIKWKARLLILIYIISSQRRHLKKHQIQEKIPRLKFLINFWFFFRRRYLASAFSFSSFTRLDLNCFRNFIDINSIIFRASCSIDLMRKYFFFDVWKASGVEKSKSNETKIMQ